MGAIFRFTYMGNYRNLFALVMIATAAGAAVGDENSLVPPVRGSYLGWRSEAVGNPYGANLIGWVGWRDPLFESTQDFCAYNFMGIEFSGSARSHESHIGARLMVQPISLVQLSLDYRRIAYPWGLVSLQHTSPKAEDRIWDTWDWGDARWGDEFTGTASIQKEYGPIQGRFKFDWSRLDIDDSRDSLYIPSEDIPCRSRDDILRGDASLGYLVASPFLSAWGVAYTDVRSVTAGYERDRAGLWVQAWPFSSRSPTAIMRYWHARARLDLWLHHELRKSEPRLEISIGWEKNLLAPLE